MRRLIFILLTILVFVGCTHKELCYDHPHTLEVDVKFDWLNSPEADPETMSLYLFSDDGSAPQRYEFTDKSGGKIRVMPGCYKAICLNSDTRNMRFLDKSCFEDFSITMKDAEHLSGLTSMGTMSDVPETKDGFNERFAMSSDSLWTANDISVLFDENMRMLSMEPAAVFVAIDIEIRNIDNMKWLTSASAALTTMAESYNLSCGQLSEEGVTIPFATVVDRNDATMKGSLLALGHCPTKEYNHSLIISALMIDGVTYDLVFDVTEQMHDLNDGSKITIVLDNISLPEPGPPEGGSTGGFKPEVGNWTSVDIGIAM